MSYAIEMDLAKNPETSQEVLEKLAKENQDNDILNKVYNNPNATQEIKKMVESNEDFEEKVIRNYDIAGYACGDEEYKYLIRDEDVEEFKSRLENEDVSDIVEDMEIGYVTNDFIMKNENGDVFFLSSDGQQTTEYKFNYVYSTHDEELYTDEEYYEVFTDFPVYINYYDTNYEIEENPIEFEYDDYEVLVPIRGANSGATAYFTKDEMFIGRASNYSDDTGELMTLDTFLNHQDYDNLKEEVFLSETTQELAKRDDVPEEFKKAVQEAQEEMEMSR